VGTALRTGGNVLDFGGENFGGEGGGMRETATGALTLGVADELPFGFGDASVENDRGNTDETFQDDPGDWKPMFALCGNMKGMALSTS